jgi:hypothetical protein
MRENSERPVMQELQALWTLTRLTIVDGELPAKPDPVEAARIAKSFKLTL